MKIGGPCICSTYAKKKLKFSQVHYDIFSNLHNSCLTNKDKNHTVSIAFPVLSSFKDGPFMSVSRKKCFPFTASFIAISLISCIRYSGI